MLCTNNYLNDTALVSLIKLNVLNSLHAKKYDIEYYENPNKNK